MAEQVYALFIDIMGFASAIEQLSDREHELLCDPKRLRDERSRLPPGLHALNRRYSEFHDYLEHELEFYHRSIDTAIAFSDSAFVVCRESEICHNLALDMMVHGYSSRTPMRIGIGKGLFARQDFSSKSLASGALVVQSRFLGTAIIRAYQAERCKAKGFRAFVHDSAVHGYWHFCGLCDELPEDEKGVGCSHELNFLAPFPRFGCEGAADHCIDDMREGVTDERALLHYHASDRAIRRLYEIGQHRGIVFRDGPQRRSS